VTGGRWASPFWYEQLSAERVRLAHPLVFDDRITGDLLTVPFGFESDGASIPRGLPRRLAGHPLNRAYLPAAILHDWEIAEQEASWYRVHTRFGRALYASGVARWRATVMTACVLAFGPRW